MNKKKLLVICPHPVNTAPGQRLKYEQYFKTWEKEGYRIVVSSFMSMSFWNIVYKKGHLFKKIFFTLQGYCIRLKNLFELKKYDAVYIFLWVTPFGWPLFEYLICKIHNKIIYDIDDLVYLSHSSRANGFLQFIKGQKKAPFLIKKARQVIVCTPTLEKYAKQYNPNVSDISSTINTELYKPVNTYLQTQPIVLGWSGSHSTAPYLKLLEPVLIKLDKIRSIKLVVMGDVNFKIQGLRNQIACNWSESIELKTLQSFDIGLYPLPDEPWVYGKSGLKALQYMALGIPTVATAIGANFRVIEHGVSGLLVNSPDEWLAALVQLIDNAELRKKLGTAGRQKVIKTFSVQANSQRYLTVLNQVCNG